MVGVVFFHHQAVLTMFLHWHGKVDALFDKSRKIIPVHLRTKKLDYLRPVSALCDYKTNDVSVTGTGAK